jgi:hypothetical protein
VRINLGRGDLEEAAMPQKKCIRRLNPVDTASSIQEVLEEIQAWELYH